MKEDNDSLVILSLTIHSCSVHFGFLSLAVHSLILSLHQVLQLQPCNTLNLLSVG